MAERAPAPLRVKEYEAIYVLRPDIDPESASKVGNRISDVIARENGTLFKVESWGRRKLAYPVRKYRKGIYVYLKFIGAGTIVTEVERNLRMQKEAVLKFLTMKLRDDVQTAELKIDPEEIKFAAVEPMSEEELDEPREKLLGLVEGERVRERVYDADLDDIDGEGDDDISAPRDDAEEES